MFHTNVEVTVGPSVPLREARDTLLLAVMAAESLFGAGRVALEARYAVDRPSRRFTIDASTEVRDFGPASGGGDMPSHAHEASIPAGHQALNPEHSMPGSTRR